VSMRQAREHLFKILFESDSNSVLPINIIYDYINRDENIIKKEYMDFIVKYSEEISANIDEIDKTIDINMRGWDINRIGVVDRVLLRISTYEILYDIIPQNISINEVVELAKIYGEEKSYEFINGVLANIIKFKKSN